MKSVEALLPLVLDSVPQPVWVVDAEGLILFANQAAVSALGYDDLSQLRGLPSHETVHYKRVTGEPYPAVECPMLRPRLTGEPAHGDDDWFVRRDGSLFPIAWWSAPLDLDGSPALVYSFTDLTERRAAERMIRERDAAEVRAVESRAAQRRIVENTAEVRRQMARDLHDGVQQRLVALLIGLQLAREEFPPGEAELVDDAIKQAQAAIDDLRDLVAGIHPAILTSRGLVPAVEALAARTPLPVVITGNLSRRLLRTVEVNAYFVVSEAITNAVKHARAGEIGIDLSADDTTLTLEVRDNGAGGAGLDGPGTGLIGIADRITALDGRFSLSSPPGGGTTLRAAVPLT
ncbi:sensor histidine kinase [Amycolatopsis sacchari]|uniref:histidine kinase n=1 Tax=Amycolatopsis sacchari TaxID=115433 RepID=A0A1I3M251_9PSEU|nr:histidine kinase [Amycolatopsis sacchari]SFI91089.1 PAS domain S-box-containing protein [Amycolatopsis sacchari]